MIEKELFKIFLEKSLCKYSLWSIRSETCKLSSWGEDTPYWFGKQLMCEGNILPDAICPVVLYLYAYTCNTYACEIHIDAIIKTSEDFFKIYIYTSHFIWKGCVCERVLETEQNCQYIDPHSYDQQRCVFLVLQGCLTGGSGAHLSTESWLSLPHLVINGSGLQTNWLPVFTDLYNSSTPPFSWGRHNCTHSTHPRSRLYYPDRSDAPVIYKGAFPILTARSGRRSIYNTVRKVHQTLELKMPDLPHQHRILLN